MRRFLVIIHEEWRHSLPQAFSRELGNRAIKTNDMIGEARTLVKIE